MISGGSTDFIRFYQIYDVIFMDFPLLQLLFLQLHWFHHGFTTFGGTVPGGPPRPGRLLFMAGHSGEVGPLGGTVSS